MSYILTRGNFGTFRRPSTSVSFTVQTENLQRYLIQVCSELFNSIYGAACPRQDHSLPYFEY
jgi:hypothetical protein